MDDGSAKSPEAENPFAAPSTSGATAPFDPETHTYKLAERGARLGGALLDGVGYITCIMAVGFAGMAADVPIFDRILMASNVIENMLLTLLLTSPYLLITAWLVTTRGQSPGKIIVGTKIVRAEDGGPIGFVRGVLLRQITGQNVLSFVPLYGLVDALVIFSQPKRCIHDYIGGSIVVNAKPVRRRRHEHGRSRRR